METTGIQTSNTPADSPSSEKDGRQPRRGNLPRSKSSHLKKSRKVVLFWLRQEFEPQFEGSSYPERLAEFQSKLKLEELESAIELYNSLVEDPRARSRFLAQYRGVLLPRLLETRIEEIRRIGVGYRDKGSLRPHHEKGRDQGEVAVWSEDVPYIVPPSTEPGKWVTRKEVIELCGGIDYYHLTMAAIYSQTNEIPLTNNTRNHR